MLPKITLNGAIMICHMGSQQDQIPALKLLHLFHFAHISRGREWFRDLRNLQTSIEWAAKIKGVWKVGGR